MPEKVIMPQLGESVVEGTLIKWLVKEGDRVEEFDSLMEVESAKVNTEIPSPATGTLLKILVEEGNTVKAGTILGWIGDPEEKIPTGDGNYVEEVSSETTQPIQTQSEVVASKQDIGRNRDLGFISPVVARLARENNIDLSLIQGTGNNNRITKKDAAWETPGEGDLFRPTELQFPDRFKSTQPAVGKIEEKVSPTKVQTPVSSGDQIIPLTKMRKAIADHMVMSKHTSPHVTTVMEADMKLVSNHLKINKELFFRQGIRLTYSSYFVAATALALLHWKKKV